MTDDDPNPIHDPYLSIASVCSAFAGGKLLSFLVDDEEERKQLIPICQAEVMANIAPALANQLRQMGFTVSYTPPSNNAH